MGHIPGSLTVGRVLEVLFNLAAGFWDGGVELNDDDAASVGQIAIVLGVLGAIVAGVLWAMGVI